MISRYTARMRQITTVPGTISLLLVSLTLEHVQFLHCSMTDTAIHDFVQTQKRLLQLEFDEEIEEPVSDKKTDGESPQNILRNLEVADVSLGLMGRTVVTLHSILSTLDTSLTRHLSDAAENAKFSKVDLKQRNLLPSHRLTVGDEVEIHGKNCKQQTPSNKSTSRGVIAGVISAVTDESISIVLYPESKGSTPAAVSGQKGGSASEDSAMDDIDDLWESYPLTVVPKSSIQVHRKIMQALDELHTHGVGHAVAGSIIEAAFGASIIPTTPNGENPTEIIPFNPNLDKSQTSAIEFVLASQCPIALIHGPPGTGKTTTIAELIKQAVLIRKWKVLVTAPSNVAVDNILERLVGSNERTNIKELKKDKKRSLGNHNTSSDIAAVRLGHPARIKETILPYSLEYLIQKSEGKEIINDIRTEIEAHLKQLSKVNSKGMNNNIDRRMLYREIKVLRTEIKSREEKVVREILNSYAQVVLATNVGAASYLLDKYTEPFDLVIIDEAAQALEATCWIPILKGKRLVLAGDHCQLPPTIKSSRRDVQLGLGSTLFERLMRKNTDQVSRMLQIQYRMNSMISNWASTAMYYGKLLSHESVMSRRLEDLPQVLKHDNSAEDPNQRDLSIVYSTMVIVDTAGCGMYESVNSAGSRYNESEAYLVSQHIRNLFRIGLTAEDIAVISPYNGQVFLLRNMLHPEFPSLEIRSVDGFQGGEKEAVVLSLVRSSACGGEDGVGFLKDDRRLNVAITRARRHCCIICDSQTISQHKFLKGLVDWVESYGEVVSAMGIEEQHSGSYIESHNNLPAPEAFGRSKAVVKKDKPTAKKALSNTRSSLSNQKEVDKSTVPETVPKDVDSSVLLRGKLLNFMEKAQVGDEMTFSLSKFERREIHQICEEIGLAHCSEGIEGVDRKVVVSKYPERNDSNTVTSDKAESVERSSDDTGHSAREKSEEMSTCDNIFCSVKDKSGEMSTIAEKSKELAAIAKERLMRREGTDTRMKSKSQTTIPQSDLDDDMEYLNAEISRMQNSHGRKIEADGKTYRTIVNGILMNKPTTAESVLKNSSAKIKLDQKLKDAQQRRKSKNDTSAKSNR